MSKRKAVVRGSFYPDSKEEIVKFFDFFEKILKDNSIKIEKLDTKSIISPHAGYIYSGFTANIAYKSVKQKPKRVVVIGPSHRVFIDGASVALYEDYETPFGDMDIDSEYSERLLNRFGFLKFQPDAHEEHSTETQAPFIKYYFPDSKIVEIVYGRVGFEEISEVVDEVLKNDENLVVISTDLSHFYSLKEAEKLDSICLKAVENLDLELFEKGCEACGITGVKAMVKSAIKDRLKPVLLDYRTSFDASGDDKRVVGYMSALFRKKE